jgi:hypothetical protein
MKKQKWQCLNCAEQRKRLFFSPPAPSSSSSSKFSVLIIAPCFRYFNNSFALLFQTKSQLEQNREEEKNKNVTKQASITIYKCVYYFNSISQQNK